MEIPVRILAKLVPIPDTGCHLWAGTTSDKGYGIVKWCGRKVRVTRLLYKLIHGRWPRHDRELLHRCDTPACCWLTKDASTHLREGTRRQNARDRHAKGRTRGCIKSRAA
jgi:hypothetical protein